MIARSNISSASRPAPYSRGLSGLEISTELYTDLKDNQEAHKILLPLPEGHEGRLDGALFAQYILKHGLNYPVRGVKQSETKEDVLETKASTTQSSQGSRSSNFHSTLGKSVYFHVRQPPLGTHWRCSSAVKETIDEAISSVGADIYEHSNPLQR
ncbi:hypothetical protein AB6A40_007985 [Gnathostoma spinigerum]|uniref:Uncharacterized protein n=1 Tax=Gnathostoma spinigerum TaxID=75299 RepID=A0ABD6ENA9_9BILA